MRRPLLVFAVACCAFAAACSSTASTGQGSDAGRDAVGPMRDFVDRYDLGFLAHAVDADGSLWSAFGVRGQPAWVFVAADGTRELSYGALSESELTDRLEALENT